MSLKNPSNASNLDEDGNLILPGAAPIASAKNQWGFLKTAGYSLMTMGYGVTKMLKGVLAIPAGIVMGASGLNPKEVYELQNAPLADWRRLWREKRAELNAGRSAAERFGKGIMGLVSGIGAGIVNGVKEALVGAIQALGGGVYIVRLLKHELGLTPEMADAAIKTGHPWGLLVGLAVKGVDKVGSFLEVLQEQVNKYKSLGEVGAKALNQLQQIKAGTASLASLQETASLLDPLMSGKARAHFKVANQAVTQARGWINKGRELKENLDGGDLQGGLKAASALAGQAIPKRFHEVGQQLQHLGRIKEKAMESTQGLYSNPEFQQSFQKIKTEMLKEAPKMVQMLTKELGIPKKMITVATDGMSVMMKKELPLEKAVQGVLKMLENSKYNEVVMEATSMIQAVQALIKSPDLINHLGLVKYTDELGVVRELDKNVEPEEFNQFIETVRLQARQQQEDIRESRFRLAPD